MGFAVYFCAFSQWWLHGEWSTARVPCWSRDTSLSIRVNVVFV